MRFQDTYYALLGVKADADPRSIKAAFRTKSLEFHPDRHENSPESNAYYRYLLNAYTVLSDTEKRAAYDRFISSPAAESRANRAAEPRRVPIGSPIPSTDRGLLRHLNHILWDVRMYLDGDSEPILDTVAAGRSVRDHLLRILAFLDYWILVPAGFPDYTMRARRRPEIDPRSLVSVLGKGRSYAPYTSGSDYLFDIMKRCDRFLAGNPQSLLRNPHPRANLRYIDCVVEFENFAIHYLSVFPLLREEKCASVGPFVWSNPVFAF